MKITFKKQFFKTLLSPQGADILWRILEDMEIRSIYETADLISRVELETPHDYTHALRATYICGKLIQLVKDTNLRSELYKILDEQSMNLALLIASYLHDIGNFVNREEHALAGSIIAFNILDKYLREVENGDIIKSIICHSIAEHSPRKVLPTTVHSSIVALSDKLDISRVRVAGHQLSTFKEYATDDVLEISLRKRRELITIEITISHPSGLYRIEKLKNFLNVYDLINRHFEINVKRSF